MAPMGGSSLVVGILLVEIFLVEILEKLATLGNAAGYHDKDL